LRDERPVNLGGVADERVLNFGALGHEIRP
jgi:hypothetical protein